MSTKFLDVTVLPYRSLSRKGFRNLMLVVSLVFFVIGIFLVYRSLASFWFLGLDVWLLYYAFKLNYKSGEISETLKLIKENLIITRSFPSGTEQKWNLEPYWTKVEILNPRINQYNLIIKSKEKLS